MTLGATLLAHEPAVRLTLFIALLLLMALWESVAPRRPQRIARLLRWSNNLALAVLNTLLLRLGFPLLAVPFASLAQQRGWGLFNLIDLPPWLAGIVALLLLDLAIYLQHRLFHAVPLLWRLHRLHHADLEFDVTTGLRFHPGEILLSMAIKLAVVALLGAPAIAVLLFELLLNGTALFNHGNVRLPERLDRWLRRLLVTPDMHRVHHSIDPDETDSNFGFNLSCWDRLFGTWRAQPGLGHERMVIGLERFRAPRELWLDRMLLQPLR
ncbi:MAG: sterol desaturase family protein [Pseudomonadales bacterium]|jgi:sterol desaturase/sphingolipid hydroxylase (fatty acid hydroxylase superfamily)|nr:sterol desaturase family protein [Pseudomonadales bacterium]MCP5332992.1 sterol desaturase family protein [Pseudomonadales bacterium]HMU91085.1 sterol desaturase family protein [Pseudomonadales bacterium]HMW15789.1 sterol desaturase family protein [Pseudomonadales bacterium]HMW84016.1 sterol desaturase family protein [Pseudomonadales bacterium]